MFGINQIVQDRVSNQRNTLGANDGPDQYITKADADAEASKRFWIGTAMGALVGVGFGVAGVRLGWF